jgi:hypothetical protein
VLPNFDSFDPAPYFLHFTNPALDGATGGMAGVQTLFSVPDLIHTSMAGQMLMANPGDPAPSPASASSSECKWYDVACKTEQGVKGALAFGAVLGLALLLVFVGFEFVTKDNGGAALAAAA